jgi:energy-coupling factor transporter transmembrane protein EcfT
MFGKQEPENKSNEGSKMDIVLVYLMAFLLPHNWTQRLVVILLLYSLFDFYIPLVFILFIIRFISCSFYLKSLEK